MTRQSLQAIAIRRRQEVYRLYREYRSYDKVAVLLGISRSVVRRLVRRYLSEGNNILGKMDATG